MATRMERGDIENRMEGDAPRGGARGPISSSHGSWRGVSLLSKACQLLGERRQLELDAEDKRTLRDGLADALAVLYPGSAQRRLQLVTAKTRGARSQAVGQPAQDALAQIWDGVVTVAAAWDHDSVAALAERLMDHCAQAAGVGLMATLQSENEEDGSQVAAASSSSASTRAPTPAAEIITLSSRSPACLGETTAASPTRSGETTAASPMHSGETTAAQDAPEPMDARHSGSSSMTAMPASCIPFATAVPISFVPMSNSMMFSGMPFSMQASMPVANEAAAVNYEAAKDPSEPSPTEPGPAEPGPTEPSPAEPSPAEPSPAEPSSSPEFRTVTFDELVARKLVCNKAGPRPRYDVMLLANVIAHFRIRGNQRSVRSMAMELGCCVASGTA